MRATHLLARARRPYYGWLIVAITFIAAALAIGSSNYAFGLFIEPLEREFGWQRTQITASLSFMAVGSLAGPFIGRLMDRYGARPILVVSVSLFGLSFLLRPLMTHLWHWYGLSLMQFVAFSGAAGLPAGRLVPIWFPRSRGRVMGITAMGNNFGGLTLPLVVGFVLAVSTWQAGFFIIGAVALLVALVAAGAVHELPPLEDAGSVKGDGSAEAGGSPQLLHGSTVQEALRSRSFYAMTLSLMLGSFTYGAVLPLVSDHLATEGVARNTVPLAVALMAAFGMVGKLLFGYLSERITARRAMMISLGGQIVFIGFMVALPSSPFIWFSVPLFGLHMGAFGALAPLIVQENFGLKAFGTISGLSQLATVVPFAFGPLLAGASFDLTESYGPGFIVVAVLFGIGILSLTQAHQPFLTGPDRTREIRSR